MSFLYNGGPGAATLWLPMGRFPRAYSSRQPQGHGRTPFKLVTNQYSLLDKTDLCLLMRR